MYRWWAGDRNYSGGDIDMEIKKVAVIGSGVMGAQIAAHIANAGVPVYLFDIVPKEFKTRNQLAEAAVEKLLKTDPAPLTHKRNAKLITPANLEDDLDKLRDVDWIIEAVLERIDIKLNLYKKIEVFRKKDSVISSNTSTIPLGVLEGSMSATFKKDFMITHFFNPPRYMRLLELVWGNETRKDAVESIREFCDKRLGKGVVNCKDTPGFIANRIGCFWLETGLLEAIRLGLTVEEADEVMGKPVGIPKTGVFGLMDLIGIDLLPLIAKSFFETLPQEDQFRKIYKEPDLIKKMITDGYTGRKGKGGFYRLNKEGDKKIKEAIDLSTGKYRVSEKTKLESVEGAKKGLRSLVTHPDKGGQYAWAVLSQTLAYTASLIPEMSDDIISVDEAMRLGYNWKYGPFELIDRLGTKEEPGAKWFAEKLASEGKPVPEFLKKAGSNSLYNKQESKVVYINTKGDYQEKKVDPTAWLLADKKEGKKPIKKNPSAALWDVGDGVACFEFTSKMNSIDPLTLEMIQKSVEEVKKNFRGLLIGNDADNFSVGANIGFILFASNIAAWKMIDGVIKQGQDSVMALKYSPFPVVSAVSGMALGGGCEISLHSDAIQAHIEHYTGLVEVGVGVIPGWGGCKEMLLRTIQERAESDSLVAKAGSMFSFISPVKTLNTMMPIQKSFEQIALAKVSKSAEEAKEMLILNKKSRISMNRKRLLADGKALVLEMAKDYKTPEPKKISLPGKTARTLLYMGIESFVKSGKATKHDEVVSKTLANVLSGGKTDITEELTEQQLLDLERENFMELVKHPDTTARIEHMLNTGKPLRN